MRGPAACPSWDAPVARGFPHRPCDGTRVVSASVFIPACPVHRWDVRAARQSLLTGRFPRFRTWTSGVTHCPPRIGCTRTGSQPCCFPSRRNGSSCRDCSATRSSSSSRFSRSVGSCPTSAWPTSGEVPAARAPGPPCAGLAEGWLGRSGVAGRRGHQARRVSLASLPGPARVNLMSDCLPGAGCRTRVCVLLASCTRSGPEAGVPSRYGP